MEKLIRLSEIRLDGGTQPRTEIDQDLVSEYAECIDQLPPVTVFFDGVKYWLADGFHRFFAHNKAGRGEIRADIRTGTQRDAILFSVGVNACHGKRRSNEDKRKAVLTLLKDEEWSKWSNSKIAEKCQVSHTFVNSIRKSLETVSSDRQERIYKNKQGQTTIMDTSNIGKKPEKTLYEEIIEEGEPLREKAKKTEKHSYVAPYVAPDEEQNNYYDQIIEMLEDSDLDTMQRVFDWLVGRLQ